MSILAWIVLGLVAGFIGSKIVNKTGEGIIRDILLGIVGAVVGGLACTGLWTEGPPAHDDDGASAPHLRSILRTSGLAHRQFFLIVNLLKLAPSSTPVPVPLSVSDTSPLVIA